MALKQIAGRKLAKTPNSRRSRNSPLSGRRWLGKLSNDGPPTAPSKTASDARQACSVSAGSGSLLERRAAPPIDLRVSLS